MRKDIIRSPKQKQHVRKYESGKVTTVNKGNTLKPRVKIVPGKIRPKPISQSRPQVRIKPRIKSKPLLQSKPEKSNTAKAAEFFGLEEGEPMCGYSYPIKKGFLGIYLGPIDMVTTKRWTFWSRSFLENKITLPIPQIDFGHPNPEATKNLKKCIDYAMSTGMSNHDIIEKFISWVLWGFGDPIIKEAPDIPERVNNFWYRTFNFGLMMQYPADYMAWLLQEYGHKGGPGWFATPINVCTMMAEITQGNMKPWETVNDPCVGTGSMVMPASNKSLNIMVQDISLIMVKAVHLQGWLYIPWLIKPFPKYMLDRLKKEHEAKK